MNPTYRIRVTIEKRLLGEPPVVIETVLPPLKDFQSASEIYDKIMAILGMPRGTARVAFDCLVQHKGETTIRSTTE